MLSTRLAITLVVLAAGVIPTAARSPRDDTGHPITIVGPSSLSAGASGTVTVTMDKVVSSNTIVVISSSSPSLAVPGTVTVTTGHSTASFAVTMAANATQGGSVTASANGSSVTGPTISLD